MRKMALATMALALVLAAALACAIPSCMDHWFDTPADWKEQRRVLRETSLETKERFERKNAGVPVGEWTERERQTYENAVRILEGLSK